MPAQGYMWVKRIICLRALEKAPKSKYTGPKLLPFCCMGQSVGGMYRRQSSALCLPHIMFEKDM